MPKAASLLSELRRRKVFRAGAIYLLSAIAALEGAQILFDSLSLPLAALRSLVALALVGLPVTLVLAWMLEQTPEGLRRARPPDDRPLRIRTQAMLFVLSVCALSGLGAWSVYIAPVTRAPTADTPDSLDATRLAVLYFDDHSPDGDLGYLADGLTEGLIHELSQIGPLRVISRNGVKPFRAGTTPLDSIARALEVGTIVEGSVVRSGDRLRVTVQLIDAARGAHLTSRTVEKPWGDLLELQDAVTEDVVFVLRRRLGDFVRRQESAGQTTSAEAWRRVQQARELHETANGRWHEGDTAGTNLALVRADSLLALAEASDPSWTAPLIARAEGHIFRASKGTGSRSYDTFDEAHARAALVHLERALELEPRDPDVLAARGRARVILWEIHGGDSLSTAAEADYRAAADADPPRPAAANGLSELLRRQGRFLESIRYAERAMEADAYLEEAEGILIRLCHLNVELERIAEANRHCAAGLERFPRNASLLELRLLLLASDVGPPPDTLEAWRLARALEEAVPPQRQRDWRPNSFLYLAAVFARAGAESRALDLIDQALALPTESPNVHYYHAHALLELGRIDEALDALTRYLELRPTDRGYIAADWWFRKLAGHPGFERITKTEP